MVELLFICPVCEEFGFESDYFLYKEEIPLCTNCVRWFEKSDKFKIINDLYIMER